MRVCTILEHAHTCDWGVKGSELMLPRLHEMLNILELKRCCNAHMLVCDRLVCDPISVLALTYATHNEGGSQGRCMAEASPSYRF